MSETKALVSKEQFKPDEIELIKQTFAKGATDAELKLFFYRCERLKLNPLIPGQIHFVKYGNNPGTIIVGIDGIRSAAARTGRHESTERGVNRDSNGKLIEGWCKIYKNGSERPIYETAPFSEYNTNKAQWVTRPETMIKKVAEAAALRIAFPDDIGSVYTEEEIAKPGQQIESTRIVQELVERSDVRPEFETVLQDVKEAQFDESRTEKPIDGPGDHVFKSGNSSRKGKSVKDLPISHLKELLNWYDESVTKGKKFESEVVGDFYYVKAHLASLQEIPPQ